MRALVFFALAACACNSADKAAPAASVKPVTGGAATMKLGDPVTAAAVPLTEIAKNPRAWENKTIATAGTITAVCQHMGCWMEIKDESGEAHVKMHGHAFFIPKTASGKKARVQAIVLKTDPDEECSQEAAQQMNKPVAKIELDATGVELD